MASRTSQPTSFPRPLQNAHFFPSLEYMELGYPYNGHNGALPTDSRYMVAQNQQVELKEPSQRVKRRRVSFSGQSERLCKYSSEYLSAAKSRVDRVYKSEPSHFVVALSDEHWASAARSYLAWHKDNPKSLLLSLYLRHGLPAPIFVWLETNGSGEYPFDAKTERARAERLAETKRLVLELTYHHLGDAKQSTTLRICNASSYQDAWHAACTMALAHIIFVPSVLPPRYTQSNLYAESRLFFRLPMDVAQELLQAMDKVFLSDGSGKERAQLLYEAAMQSELHEMAALLYCPPLDSPTQAATSPTSTASSTLEFRPGDPYGPVSSEISPIHDSNAPPKSAIVSSSIARTPVTEPETHFLSTDPFCKKLRERYVLDVPDEFEGLEEVETEVMVKIQLQRVDFSKDDLIVELAHLAVKEIAEAPEGVERSSMELFELWKRRKLLVSKTLLSLPSPAIFPLLRTKIMEGCSDSNVLIKMIHMLTQLLAISSLPQLAVKYLFTPDFISHLHGLIKWVGDFESANILSSSTMTLLGRLFVLVHETTRGLDSSPLFSCSYEEFQVSLSALERYYHASHWVATAHGLLKSHTWGEN